MLNEALGNKMIRNTVKVVLTVFSVWKMLQFSMPKLLANERSVMGFSQIGKAFHISGTLFMYVTGAVELVIAILLGYSLLAKNTRQKIAASLGGNTLLLFTMAGLFLPNCM